MKKNVGKFLNLNLSGKNKKYNNIMLLEIVISFLFILFGSILLFNKTTNDNFIAIFLGIIILMEAVLNIYSFIMTNSNSLFKMNVFFSILYFVIAVLLFTNFIKFINYIVIYFGSFLIVTGIKSLINSIKLKVVREESFLIVFVMSILVILLGGLIIFYPFASFGVLETVAIFAILYGILNISTSNLLRNRVDKFLSKVDND